MIKYNKVVILTENNAERSANVEVMRGILPDIEIRTANLDTVWDVFTSCFRLPDGADGLLLMEDDILLCRDFSARVDAQIQAHRDLTISFFERALSRKPICTGIYPGSKFNWCQCNFFPKRVCRELSDRKNISDFIAYWPTRNELWNYPSDTYIAWVLKRMREKYYMEIPFLVQHQKFKSTLGGRSTKRVSRYFADDMEAQNSGKMELQ